MSGLFWTQAGPNMFTQSYGVLSALPSDVYMTETDINGNVYLKQQYIVTDSLVKVKGGIVEQTLNEIESFWDAETEANFRKYGMVHKRGYLMHGKPGMGKTVTVNLIMRGIVERGGVVLLCRQPGALILGIKKIREIEPDRKILCVFEDIDSIMNNYGSDEILELLDGYHQCDGVLNIATTNYLDRLPARIAKRPRRFDRVLEILPPTDEERQQFFEKKLVHGEDVTGIVKMTKGLSYASLSEVIIAVFCLKKPLKEVVSILKSIELDIAQHEGMDDDD